MSEIPAEVREKIEAARKQQLKELDLSYGNLTSIPPEVFRLEHLERLDLDWNEISEIPPTIERLRNLKHLYLDFNRITAVPSSIGQLQNLEILHLYGFAPISLPQEIGQLSRLTELSVGRLAEVPEISICLPCWRACSELLVRAWRGRLGGRLSQRHDWEELSIP